MLPTPAEKLQNFFGVFLQFHIGVDRWSASAREIYFSIIEQADEVVYVSQEYREGCMLERNRYMVNHAACLLAVYNGEWRGGTAMTVRYARKLGRKIIILNPV